MKNFYLSFLAAAFLFFTSCAKDLTVTYQMESANTGKVVLKPSTSTDRTMVTINDQLVVDGKFVKSVTILNVPNGDHVIHYMADNSFYKTPLKADFPIKMENGKSMTKLVEVPPYSTGYWVLTTGALILPWMFFLVP